MREVDGEGEQQRVEAGAGEVEASVGTKEEKAEAGEGRVAAAVWNSDLPVLAALWS